MKFAERMDRFEAYLGTAMNEILTRMKNEGKDVINLGLGDPDVVPSDAQRQSLADACMDESNHHYPSFYSAAPLKEAIAGFYKRNYQVDCDPETETLALLGSADGLFHIHTVMLDPGDVALVPDPCYPAYVAGVQIAGGVIEPVPLLKENGFVPDLKAHQARGGRKGQDDLGELPQQPPPPAWPRPGSTRIWWNGPTNTMWLLSRTTPIPRFVSTATARPASSSSTAPRK